MMCLERVTRLTPLGPVAPSGKPTMTRLEVIAGGFFQPMRSSSPQHGSAKIVAPETNRPSRTVLRWRIKPFSASQTDGAIIGDRERAERFA
jgi:hypothetical protein